MTTTGGGDGASAGQLVISRQMRNGMLVDLLAAGSHGDSVTLGVGSRLPGDMRKTDMEEELLAWEGIIKLSNIKIQYHQKKKKEQRKRNQTNSTPLLFLQLFIIADVVHEVCDS